MSGHREETQKPKFRGLVLAHQVLKELEAKNLQNLAKFDQKCLLFGGFLALSSLNHDGCAHKLLNMSFEDSYPRHPWRVWAQEVE